MSVEYKNEQLSESNSNSIEPAYSEDVTNIECTRSGSIELVDAVPMVDQIEYTPFEGKLMDNTWYIFKRKKNGELELVTTYEDRQLSKGKLYRGNTICYEGDLDRYGRRQGKGREYDIKTSQLIYVGEFVNDVKQGNGFEIGINGDRTKCLIGTWKDGEMMDEK